MRDRSRIGIPVAVVVTVFAILITLFQFLYLDQILRKDAEEEASLESELIAEEIATSVEHYFNKALAVTQTYARNILIYRNNNVSRETVYRILESTLRINRNYLAVWTMWEPDAYDGKDMSFRNDKLHDANGSFAMTYYFKDGEINYEGNDTADYKENYYTIPKVLKRPVILEPYYYQYNKGEQTFYETSLTCPIIEGGQFLGIMGIDMDMSDLQADFNSMTVPGDPFICLLSNSGDFITHSSKDYVGQNIETYYDQAFSEVRDSLSKGKVFSSTGVSGATGEKVIRYFYPVSMKEMAKPWYMMIELSEKNVFAKVNKIRRASRDYLISSIVLLIYLGFNIVDRRIHTRKMLDSISKLENTRNELNGYKESLEKLVEERTSANRKLNEDLHSSNEELNMLNEVLKGQKVDLENSVVQLRETHEKMIISEKMASLGVLASGVAHEINNPLHFIKGGVMGLENYIDENLHEHKETLTPLLKAITTGVNRSADIVTSLSHYSRTDNLHDVACEINFILDNCIVILQSQLRERIQVIRNYSTENCNIRGNEGKLHQAFLNIIANANHAIDGEGVIAIDTSCSEGMIVIKITDNGKGMDEETLKRVFDPFFTTKEPGKGTGLGLSITHRIIQEHKGSIKFESKPGAGTSVTVSLPCEKNI